MKKKVFALLCVGIIAVTGCGQADTSAVAESTTEYVEETTEEVVEATVVEETTEVAEEPVKEKIPVDLTDSASFMNKVLENYEAQKYMVIERNYTTYNVDDPTAKEVWTGEYLFDWNSNIACSIYQDGTLRYQDYTNDMSYGSNEDLTGFLSFSTTEKSFIKDEFEATYTVLKQYIELFEKYDFLSEYVVTELTEGDYAGYYCATNQYTDEENSLIYTVNIYVDPYTLLPINITNKMCDTNHELVLEDGTTVAGEYFIIGEDSYSIQYLEETDEDFATFQSEIQLPADDECTLLEE